MLNTLFFPRKGFRETKRRDKIKIEGKERESKEKVSKSTVKAKKK